ncbi:related to SET domain protein [Cephalotrichum gorgonifer]|uniref:Related to SET domain protein n=1 Tax=Cephalotrichum gorgonifer TaxID=2041049 RepID=A0AAE8MQU9_9PEZI|nr:related to SET domain protein [Cephalotrichum gorgonifer]
MASSKLSIDSLPIWASLNDVKLSAVEVGTLGEKGQGIVSSKPISEDKQTAEPVLVRVPHDIILCEDVIEGYAKADMRFRDLLDAMEPQSLRVKTLVFLISQRVHATQLTPWTEYVRYLPEEIFVPTMWHDHEVALLQGTSLETAVNAKLTDLVREFDLFREKTEDLPSWRSVWDSRTLSLRDWILADAWYRSRCLELPRSGTAMVPVLDMANHSSAPTARYEETDDHEALLLLRHDAKCAPGDEITITYGEDKSAAEILFSYGFIDTESTRKQVVLPVPPLEDDPLVRAKLFSFGKPPMAEIELEGDDKVSWKSPFAYFLCLNEEDGLGFRTLQEVSGARQLRVFWQEEDVTDRVDDFESLVEGHPSCKVFRLRVVSVLEDLAATHLAHMKSVTSPEEEEMLREIHAEPRRECAQMAQELRSVESEILEAALASLQEEKTRLLEDEGVLAYLGSMETAENEQAAAYLANEEEDFS